MTNKAALLLRSGAVVIGEVLNPETTPEAKAYADGFRQMTGRTGKVIVFRDVTVESAGVKIRNDMSLTGCFMEDVEMDLGDIEE